MPNTNYLDKKYSCCNGRLPFFVTKWKSPEREKDDNFLLSKVSFVPVALYALTSFSKINDNYFICVSIPLALACWN